MLEDALRLRLGPHMEHISHPVLKGRFFEPLVGAFAAPPYQRNCPSCTEAEFLELGVIRVICDPRSGRGFLHQSKRHTEDIRARVGATFASDR